MYQGVRNRLLGWPHLLAGLAARSRTLFGRERIRALSPLADKEAILARLGDVQALREVHRLGEQSPLSEVPDVRQHLTRVSKEGILDGPALRDVARVLRTGSEIAHFLSRHGDLLSPLAHKWPEIGGGDQLARRIERSIDPGGEVTDEASVDVAEARDKVRSLHARLRRTAEDMTRDREWTDKLQEPYFTVRGDRYVLPIKAPFRYQVGGIVHNVSNTGETVFIEPPNLISLGNELAIAIAEEEEAVRMVLAELTRLIGNRSESISYDMDCIGELDALEASARLSDDIDASAPDITDEEDAVFELRSLRHPLLVLQGKKVVENNVRFEGDARCLVVSGPNAGGKTVTVTAVALCALMVRHGLPIPADPGSVMPLYRDVVAVLGDEQDLERDLSTFSAHLEALRGVLESAGSMVLVVVDEICADTDPREGAALASAVLDSMLARGSHVLVTTHFEALKAQAAGSPRYMSAAVGFDADRMQPTYRLRLHVSGGSSAIEIAARTGLPKEVLESARAHLSGDGGALATALAALESKAAATEQEADRLRELQAGAQEHIASLEAAREKLELERRELRAEARAELFEEIEGARREVKETIARLQAEPKMRKTAEAERQLDELADWARTDQARDEEAAAVRTDDGSVERQPPKEKRAAPSEQELRPGSFVRAPTLGDREGEILEMDERSAQIAFGSLKMRLSLDKLVPLRRAPRKAASARMASSRSEREAKADKMQARATGAEEEHATVDLRGMRVEDALALLDKRLDELLTSGVSRVRIVHGHGTGALRRAVREHLAISPHVAGTEVPGEDGGGDGATVARLDA